MNNPTTLPGYGDPSTWGGRTPNDEAADKRQDQIDEEAETQRKSMRDDFTPQDLQDVFDAMPDNAQCIFALQILVAAMKSENHYKEFWKAFDGVAIGRAEFLIRQREEQKHYQ